MYMPRCISGKLRICATHLLPSLLEGRINASLAGHINSPGTLDGAAVLAP
jgi:hypothetical protein